MTLIPITATQTGLSLGPVPGVVPGPVLGFAPDHTIAATLAGLPARAPVVILVHGKGYRPGDPALDPHALIFAPRSGHARSRYISWPRRLGFALPGPNAAPGLCLPFGWDSQGDLWRATAAADAAAHKLARLVQLLHRLAPERRVDLIGHSLGARVILGAVPLLAANTLGRIVLLAGADFAQRAERACTSHAGRSAEFFNITTRENDFFDFLFERAYSPMGRQRALGTAGTAGENWLNIQLDNPATEAALHALGLPLGARKARICHWSVYLRPGVFRFYRALIRDRQRLTLPLLCSALDIRPEPRWSRLLRPLPAAPAYRGPIQQRSINL